MAVATVRNEVRIARGAGDVWARVSDAGNLASWFPSMTETYMETPTRRVCVLGSGLRLEEDIVTNDPERRRFQYRLTGPALFESHLATVDVVDLGPDDSFVLYSTEVLPPALGAVLNGAIDEALQTLKTQMEEAP